MPPPGCGSRLGPRPATTQLCPPRPQSVALYLGHLAASGRSIAAIQLARSAISHFHAAAGMQKDDNPARHPVVAEAVRGWRNWAPAPRQAGALTADALARVREGLRLPRRGRGGRMESAETAQRRAALDLAIIGVLADGGLRRSEAADLTWGDVELWPDGTARLTVQKGKNQPELVRPPPYADNPAASAMTDSARPLCDCPEPCACYAEGYTQGITTGDLVRYTHPADGTVTGYATMTNGNTRADASGKKGMKLQAVTLLERGNGYRYGREPNETPKRD